MHVLVLNFDECVQNCGNGDTLFCVTYRSRDIIILMDSNVTPKFMAWVLGVMRMLPILTPSGRRLWCGDFGWMMRISVLL